MACATPDLCPGIIGARGGCRCNFDRVVRNLREVAITIAIDDRWLFPLEREVEWPSIL